MTSTYRSQPSASVPGVAVGTFDRGSQNAGSVTRRYRREANLGPRCPHCAGPLVFGEGCSLCPICGFSACST